MTPHARAWPMGRWDEIPPRCLVTCLACAERPTMTPQPEPAGVQHHIGPLPPIPPGPIASSLKSVVHASLNQLPPDSSGARVAVSHDKGVELVFAHRGANGRWQVDAWVGKNFRTATSIEWTASAQVLW